MPVSAATLSKLIAAGLSGQDLIDVVASIDADMETSKPRKERDIVSRPGFAEWWQLLRRQVFERDGYVCVYCGDDVSQNPQCDHVIPLILGGSSDPSNLATACKRCNSSKAGKRLEDWRPSWQ